MDLNPAQFSPLSMPKRKPVASQPPTTSEGYTVHPHAAQQAKLKGFLLNDVLAAANDPQTTYENVKQTRLRADQTDADAIRYGKKSGMN